MQLDQRFVDNPLVVGNPGIRFYAGAPINLSDGLRMGTLCVIDREPRALTGHQRLILTQLALAASEALEQRVLARCTKARRRCFIRSILRVAFCPLAIAGLTGLVISARR